ncbi:MAG: radical SAM protein [Deltaproteobacteria bacterium]|nr:MAG: radical SAM protein [Deltaproteobacteria bacterium]
MPDAATGRAKLSGPMIRFTARNYARIAQAAVTRRVPVYAHWGITHRCNLTCKMCGIWRYGDRKEELTPAEIRVMAAKMARLGVVQVSIGGGEPFASPHLEDAVEAFIGEGINLRVLTNGVPVGNGRNVVEGRPYLQRVDRCIELGLKNFSISLDSLDPQRFDDICEVEGAWHQAVRTMTHIGQRLYDVSGAMPTINCVVSNLNLEELPDMVHFARDIGFAVSFLPVELLNDPKEGVRNWEARFIRYRPEMGLHNGDEAGQVGDRIDRAYDAILDMKARGLPVLNSSPYLEASRMYLKTGRFPAEGCDAGRLYFSVAPNGQFTICHRTVHQHLDFMDPGFEDYFHSAEYEHKRMLEAASCEGCMRACWIDTSSMFRTMQGFFETAKLTLSRRQGRPLTYHEAVEKWARVGAAVARPAAAG